jgi:subtilase family serine protease
VSPEAPLSRVPVLLAVAALAGGATTAAVAAPSASGVAHANKRVCAAPTRADVAACHARVVVDANGKPVATPAATTPSGLWPADLVSAYKVPASSTTATIAIVDAFHDPTAESDLATYRARFGLPPCTTANGCLSIVNQNGATSPLPATNGGWAQEISLDLDMASAICPSCHLLLVEATSNAFTDLAAAVDRAAATPGVVAISNSYGGGEFSQETSATYNAHYDHPHVAVTVSSGDAGYGVEFPAASQYVVAVGGTSLTRATNARGWNESAWSGAGSGCSSYVTKPSWQADASCARRTVADVSAVADPNTGVAVYGPTGSAGTGPSGWMVFGGTSASAPIIGAMYALGTAPAAYSYPAQKAYQNRTALFDVTSGTNGRCVRGKSTSGAYLCQGKAGYDGPTGLGTPNGLGAF